MTAKQATIFNTLAKNTAVDAMYIDWPGCWTNQEYLIIKMKALSIQTRINIGSCFRVSPNMRGSNDRIEMDINTTGQEE
jgi:hypothetical protein